ncbi:uncharacterized protein LOC34618643 [Cyclospora cayetanensis]|uniref:Uncharacterized protein LOC34618643 n=1 Tax=Cyclospora cayetanensis TaxID=88456 RepID=A0A6P6S1F9_9EIME|nr:uncharacterized protein LOC34618643 [Cyclospora cayetanensis]
MASAGRALSRCLFSGVAEEENEVPPLANVSRESEYLPSPKDVMPQCRASPPGLPPSAEGSHQSPSLQAAATSPSCLALRPFRRQWLTPVASHPLPLPLECAMGGSPSKAFKLLSEAPQAVRDLWKVSFEAKTLRKRHVLLHADLQSVCSWISLQLESELLPLDDTLAGEKAFAAASAVYAQLLPQLLWATAVVALRLTTVTLQETTALWARLQLLALDATTSNAAAEMIADRGGSVTKSLRPRDSASLLYGPSRVFGRRKRRKPQQKQQQREESQSDHDFGEDTPLGALEAVANDTADPEALLQQIDRFRSGPKKSCESDSLMNSATILSSCGKGPPCVCTRKRNSDHDAACPSLSLLFGHLRFLGGLPKQPEIAPVMSSSPVTSPFAALRRDLLQLGALRSPGDGLRPPPGDGSSVGSSTTSLPVISYSNAATAVSAAVNAGTPSNSSSPPVGTSAAEDRWTLMPWQSAAAAAAAAMKHGLSRRSSFSSVASDLMPLPHQRQLHQEPLMQGPLGFEVPVGAAVDPMVASPFRMQQQHPRPLLASEPSSVGSGSSKRTGASGMGGTPDGRWLPDLQQQQDVGVGEWQLPEEDSGWHQGAAEDAHAAHAAGSEENRALALAIPETLQQNMWRSQSKRKPKRLHKLQIDTALTRSACAATTAREAGGGMHKAQEEVAEALRVLQAGAEDGEALRRSFRRFPEMLERHLRLQGLFGVYPQPEQHLMQCVPRKKPNFGVAALTQVSLRPAPAAGEGAAVSPDQPAFPFLAGRTSASPAGATAAAAGARRRRSSWLEKENVLKGFDSPLLPSAEASDGETPESLPQGLYRKKDGAIVTLWPSAASLYELVEKHYMPGAAGYASHPYNTPPPPLSAPPPVQLSELLNGHSRRTAARAFRDALALHSHGLCTLRQEMPAISGGPTTPQRTPDGNRTELYPPLLIISQDAEEEQVWGTPLRPTTAAPTTPPDAHATEATAAAEAASWSEAPPEVPISDSESNRTPPRSFPGASARDAQTAVDAQTAAGVREHAAAVATAATDTALAEAAKRGEAPISDDQLEQAVQWLVTGLLDRLQEESRVHAHALVYWFVREILPSSALAGVASATAWEAKAVYAICTLIDEGVFLATRAARTEAPVDLEVLNTATRERGEALCCPFWLEGVAEVE